MLQSCLLQSSLYLYVDNAWNDENFPREIESERELLSARVRRQRETRRRRSIVANANFPRRIDGRLAALSIATGSNDRFPRRLISFELSRFATAHQGLIIPRVTHTARALIRWRTGRH